MDFNDDSGDTELELFHIIVNVDTIFGQIDIVMCFCVTRPVTAVYKGVLAGGLCASCQQVATKFWSDISYTHEPLSLVFGLWSIVGIL